MTKQTTHTAGEWQTAQGASYPHPVIIRADKNYCDGPVKIAEVYHSASESAEDRAKFIVTACNSHADLVAALEHAAEVILSTHPEVCKEGAMYCSCFHAVAYRQAIAQIAKAKATGEGEG